jgi:LPXTG-motif cell wall-anchored protein
VRTPAKVALFFAATVGMFSVGAAIAPPWADAHSSGATFSNARCADNSVWNADLAITATNPELHPTATIQTSASPISNAHVPYNHTFIIPNTRDSYTVSIVLRWDDGFTEDLGSFTAHRPTGCVVPPTTATPPTTTCAEANPPRDDCHGATTAPPTTVITIVEPTTIPVVVESLPQLTAPTTAGTPVTVARTGPSRTVATNLPPTGSSSSNFIIGGVAGLLVGGVLLVASRRRAS